MVVSPKAQLNVKGPTPPLVVAVKLTEVPTSGVAGVKVKLTENTPVTVTVWAGDVTETPLASVALTVTLKLPAEV